MINKSTKKAAAKEFAQWAGIDGSLVEQWIDSFTECDVMFAHGPGHQSMTQCENTYDGHSEHYADDMHGSDARLSDQTYTRKRDGKTFRLAFHDRGWY